MNNSHKKPITKLNVFLFLTIIFFSIQSTFIISQPRQAKIGAASMESQFFVAPDGLSSNDGTEASPWNIEKANSSLLPGETAILLDGIYTATPIAPVNSGTKGAYITYRAANKHLALFTNMNAITGSRGAVSIFINDKSYIAIDGIKVENVKRWVMGERSHHITLENGYFENGSGWINCRFEDIGDGMRIRNNHFTGGTDLVSLDGGSGHLVEGNFFGDASHTGLVLLGVQRSVVRNNVMLNRLWRTMEVESQRHEPYALSKYNLIENNYFDFSPVNSIQYAGNNSIIRKNVFRHSIKGMDWSNYLGSVRGPEAWHNEHNRFYNNVIAECGSNNIVNAIIEDNKLDGISVAGTVSSSGYGVTYLTNLFNPPVEGHDDVAYGDNIMVNNILYKNANTFQSSSSSTTQLAFDWNATPEFGRYYSNNFYSGSIGSDVVYFVDGPSQNPSVLRNFTLLEFEQQYPDWATDNIEVDPQFVDPDDGDFELKEGSPVIDKGMALTKTTSAGAGTIITVEDALYFTNGYGIVAPDIIRINSERVKILNIDYEANKITIDQNTSWQQGDKIYFDYAGDGPDLGAFEYGLITDIKESRKVGSIESYKLLQNYPNPFNPSTMIEYNLDEKANVRLEIFDTLGRKLITLVEEIKSAGTHQAIWDSKNRAGDNVSSGIYFYSFSVEGKDFTAREVKKMVLLR
ncbi:MAG: T9SS type A sorting domain-containing protein [Melioribacteraceae bacterium]|nr:T9SS type A sorting domain-containing protein [Melioribacteraceae bacterium]